MLPPPLYLDIQQMDVIIGQCKGSDNTISSDVFIFFLSSSNHKINQTKATNCENISFHSHLIHPTLANQFLNPISISSLKPSGPSSLLLMEEILHQLIGRLSHYVQGFIHPRWFAGFLNHQRRNTPNTQLGGSSQLVYKWLITMTSFRPLRIGATWEPFQMARFTQSRMYKTL